MDAWAGCQAEAQEGLETAEVDDGQRSQYLFGTKKPVVWCTSSRYQATGWARPRRVVAKVESHQGELWPRVGFIVTNLTWPNRRVVNFYNCRGTAEQWIREGKNALRWTRLSYHAFRHNAVRLQLHALA